MFHIATVVIPLVLLIWRWRSIRRQPTPTDRPFRTAVKKELASWALTWVVFAGGLALLFVLVDLFGPIPPVHEW